MIFNTHHSFLGFISSIAIGKLEQPYNYATVTGDVYHFPDELGYAIKRVYY